METDILQKLNQALEKTKEIAIILPERLTIDCLSAAVALKHKFAAEGKTTQIFSSSKAVPQLAFLPVAETVFSNFSNTPELVIKVKGDEVKPSQLRYEKSGDDLLVYVSSEQGKFTARDVEVLPSSDSFDVFIILGAASVDELGAIYSNNSEKFFNTPKITINNNINQEYFSNLTWVELEASSLSEQLTNWFGPEVLSKKNDFITTSLLAGIISQTGSFRDPKTTPESLATAASLVKHGARQQDIIKHLFKTKPFNLLQLWGRALARIKIVNQNHLYTVLTKQDFEKTNSAIDESENVLEEIITMTGGYQLISLIAEADQGVRIMLAAQPHVKLVKIGRQIESGLEAEAKPLPNNFQFITINLPQLGIVEAEQIISALQPTGI